MLIRLLPEQIMARWQGLEGHVERSLPPIAIGADANQVMYSLLMETSQCWTLVDKEEQDKGFLITTTFLDISDVRTLLVYEAVIFDKDFEVDWKAEFETLREFAKARSCHKVAAFVANRKVVDWLKDFGASTDFSYVCKDV